MDYLAGAVTALCGFILGGGLICACALAERKRGGRGSAEPPAPQGYTAAERRFFAQLQNMLNYDGSEAGQKEID